MYILHTTLTYVFKLDINIYLVLSSLLFLLLCYYFYEVHEICYVMRYE